MSVILTHTGRYLDFTRPEDYPFPIEEIALVLSRVHRFSGQGLEDLSVTVLEHSLRVYHLTPSPNPRVRLGALLHDAHEAYVGDMPTPLKRLVGNAYKDIETRVQAAMLAAHGLALWHVDNVAVKTADATALSIERCGSMPLAIEEHPLGSPARRWEHLHRCQAQRRKRNRHLPRLINLFLLAYYEELSRCE